MGSPATDVSGKRTVRVITVSKTVSPKTSMSRSITSRACSVRRSNMVTRMPRTSRSKFRRSRTLPTVSVSSARPRSEKYSHSMGMITPCAMVKALTVSRPNEGWQSTMMKS